MGLKYKLEYKNVNDDLFRCEIYHTDYTSSEILVSGKCTLEYAAIDDVLHCIRGANLQIELEASTNLSFEDLYTEDEKVFKVKFFKNDIQLFYGYLKPDGLFTDFINDHWVITLDCIDGLGILKNLSFVKDTGLYFLGKMKEIDIIYHCLHRTALNMPINTNIQIYYDLADENLDILQQVYNNTERFVKADDKTILDCEAVLKSVLEKYSAVCTQYNGEWYIYQPLNIETESEFYHYEDNVFINKKTIDTTFTIGSNINGFYPHHCNANQRISLKGSTRAYRVHYIYGNSKNTLIENPTFEITNPVGNPNISIIDLWQIDEMQFILLDPGIQIKPSGYCAFTSNGVNVILNDDIKIVTNFSNSTTFLGFNMKIKITNGTITYYYNGSGWVQSVSSVEVAQSTTAVYQYSSSGASGTETIYMITGSGGNYINEIVLPPMPITGTLTIEAVDVIEWTIPNDLAEAGVTPPLEEKVLKIFKIDILGVENQNSSNVKGEFHTVQLEGTESSNIKNNKEIYNGDQQSDLYVGTIYNSSQDPTEFWHHKGVLEVKPILHIMAIDSIVANQKPSKIFTGDIYGYLPYIGVIEIDGLSGKYTIQSYTYRTSENIISLELAQFYTNYDLATTYEYQLDYGNTVKPTIK